MNPADGEQLLARLIALGAPKADVAAAARRLMRTHRDIAPILELTADDLSKMGEISDASARILTMVPALSRYLAMEEAQSMTLLDTFARAGEYLRRLYIGVHNECFYLLCLDAKGQYLDCSLLQQGSVDETAFYLRHILEKTARTHAYAVVLSHNHPSGTREPSRGDILCTGLAIDALLPLGILVLDHVVVADGVPISMRMAEQMPGTLFARQRLRDRLIDGWLAGYRS
ncbi:MAG: JAB domain-containing protein [Clostridia bacterium]